MSEFQAMPFEYSTQRLRRDGRIFSPHNCLLGLSAVVLLIGCGPQDQIRHYTVEKPPQFDASADPIGSSEDRSDGTSRIIGAIVPRNERSWFFKIVGDDEPVAEQMEEFLQFLGSVKFTDGPEGEPTWTLPEGWLERPGSGIRHATIVIEDGQPPLEMSVTQLAYDGSDYDAYVLENVNRWRGQLGLAPVGQEELFDSSRTEEVLKVPVQEAEATLVNLVGRLDSSPMGRAPFAGRFTPSGATPARDSPAAASEKLTYEEPQGWQSSPASGMRKAAFLIETEDQSAEMTAIVLPGTAGGLLANVNRWRAQVGLQPVSEDELETSSQEIEVAGQMGRYVQLDGPDAESQSILGVILQRSEQSWYFKLKGDSELVNSERARFEEFVGSVQFASDDN